jgi:hypothetical protein
MPQRCEPPRTRGATLPAASGHVEGQVLSPRVGFENVSREAVNRMIVNQAELFRTKPAHVRFRTDPNTVGAQLQVAVMT